MKYQQLGLIVLFGVVLASPVLAAGGGSDPIILPDGAKFSNPLGDETSNISSLLLRITRWLLGISLFIALAALIYGGVSYITSLGDDKKVTQAKHIVMYAVIGLVIIFSAFVIISTVTTVLGIAVDKPAGS